MKTILCFLFISCASLTFGQITPKTEYIIYAGSSASGGTISVDTDSLSIGSPEGCVIVEMTMHTPGLKGVAPRAWGNTFSEEMKKEIVKCRSGDQISFICRVKAPDGRVLMISCVFAKE